MILSDFLKALGQIGDPRFRRVFWRGLGLTVLLLVAVYVAFLMLVRSFAPQLAEIPGLGDAGWIQTVLTLGTVPVMILLSVFLMVPVASVFTGLYLDEVVNAVEDSHYPDLPDVAGVPLAQSLIDAVNFFGVLTAANILALVGYFFAGPFAPFLFWGVNGYLLGREYFTLVAMRRLGRLGARALRKRNAGQIWLAGVLMAAPLSVPIINLFVPVLAVASFTHQFHRLLARAPLPPPNPDRAR
jgi:CysZ protein